MDKLIEENVIYILGSRGVGKTSLINKLTGKDFNQNEIHSEKGISSTKCNIDNTIYNIKELTDDGNFNITSALKNYLEEIMVIIILFSIDDEKSLEYAKSLIFFIESNLTYNLDLKIILIGNKYDSKKDNNPKIKVNILEAENFSREYDDMYYFEISCKTDYNIESIYKILHEIKDSKYIEKEDNIHEDSIHEGTTAPSYSCAIF